MAASSIRSASAAGSRGREADPALGLARAEVRRHHDHRVGEVHRAALAVGQPAVVHHLQQHVPDLGVGLLDLVEQDHGVRAPAHGLGQLAAVAVADVAGRRADQPRDRVRLAELGHVDPDERLLGREQPLRERLDQLGLADAGRAEEQEACRAGGRPRTSPTRARRIVSATTSTASSWPIDALVQVVLELVAGARARRRPARPTGMPVRAATTAATSVSPTARDGRRRPARPAAPRARRSRALSSAGALVVLGVDGGLFSAASLARSRRSAPRAPPRAQLHARGGLVDQVDRLVGQVVLGDVAVAQPRGRGSSAASSISTPWCVLVGAAQAAQDRRRSPRPTAPRPSRARSGGRARSRARSCGTRPAWWRRSSRSSPRASSGLRMLAASIAPSALPAPSTVCSSSTNRTILPSDVGDLVERRLQALLELAAELGAGDHAGQVERDDARVRAASRARRRRRCAGPGPRRSRSCRRRPRRSARRCSCAGGRGSRPSARSRPRGRSRGRCGRRAASAVRSRPNSSSAGVVDCGSAGAASGAAPPAAATAKNSRAQTSHRAPARRPPSAASTTRTLPGRWPQFAQTGKPSRGRFVGVSMESVFFPNLSWARLRLAASSNRRVMRVTQCAAMRRMR